MKRAATPLIQWWSRSYVLFFFANPVLLELISAQVCTALAQLRRTHRAELERIAASFERLSGDAQGAAAVGADTAATVAGHLTTSRRRLVEDVEPRAAGSAAGTAS